VKLERLEVGGFGRLRDVEFEFHPRLTVLLGENESGKSTVHRALRAALYGIDAGGPGRPTDRSEWARWTPWESAAYSVVLTYALDSGRRFRVARRLQSRDHTCQVRELGGADVTAELRVGRSVAPGLVHLGIDEAVFCASACVSDDGLRLGSGDTPAARAAEVQEAIERLADSGDATTAAQALATINEAIARVGSERRSTSPLGRATIRLRQLDVQVDEARRRLWTLAAEEERLRSLETEAAGAEARREAAERRWLLGRLAAIAAQRLDLQSATAELTQVAAEVEGTAHLAGFPAEAEDRVIQAAAEVQELRRSADEARARADAASSSLGSVRRRRAEISAGVRALGRTPVVELADAAEAADIERELSESVTGRRRADELTAALGRRDALNHEIVATGVGGAQAASVEVAADLVASARGGRPSRVAKLAVTSVLVAGAVAAAVSAVAHRGQVAVLAGAVTVAAALVILGIDRLVASEADQARRRLARLFPGATLDDEGLARLAERLPRLRALFAEAQREDVRVEALTADLDDAARRLAGVAGRARALAERCQLEAGATAAATGGAEATVRAVLNGIAAAVAIQHRRIELQHEDAELAGRERDLEQVVAEGGERGRIADSSAAHLRLLLGGAGIDPSLPAAAAVSAFRVACAGRRRHDAALRRLGELCRRGALSGDAETLGRLVTELEARLARRGGDPAAVADAEPLDQARLQELELEAEHARQGAVAASTAATALRARLTEMRATMPALADLEDERAACAAARERGLAQLAALRQAAALIETATRSIHRDLAPRLAASVADRLTLLTEGRYSAVNVDTAHFEVSLLGRDRPDLVPLDLLSHGTRDQVALLLRLALAEVLSGGGEAVPLLLDEPLLSSDPQRRLMALRFLWNLSATNQVVLSTSDPGMVGALVEACDGERPAVLVMGAPEPTVEATGRAVARARSL
jgi:DNA repair exonuclease SbcCD ATPase subunit